MKVKFIVTARGIVFGSKEFKSDQHLYIAAGHKLKDEEVFGGGIADLTNRVISGTSYAFGPYKPEEIRKLLLDWVVEEPSDYDTTK